MSHTTKKRSDEPHYALKDLSRAAETARFYGFKPVKTPRIEKKDVTAGQTLLEQKKEPFRLHELYPLPEERASIFRTYTDWELHDKPQPVMLYYDRPFGGSRERRSSSEIQAGLEIIGSASGITDALAIKTTCAILSDYGFKDLVVDINSLGDKDSILRFERELGTFIRKQSGAFSPELKQILRNDPYEIFFSQKEECVKFREHTPQTLSCLSDSSSYHFKEVLEHLESLELPYRINHVLMPEKSYSSHTAFEIHHIKKDDDEQEVDSVLAFGSRHNHISKKFGFKKDIPAMTVNIRFKKQAPDPKPIFKINFKPKFYFIQFGSMAKLKSLPLIEKLRLARIPIHHSLTRDKFVSQLSGAEDVDSQFVIIMGQKEALDDTVVVRHTVSRAQQIVPIIKLADYLSRLR